MMYDYIGIGSLSDFSRLPACRNTLKIVCTGHIYAFVCLVCLHIITVIGPKGNHRQEGTYHQGNIIQLDWIGRRKSSQENQI